MPVRSLRGVNAYWGELEALMKAVFQEIRVLLSPAECDGGHTTMHHGALILCYLGKGNVALANRLCNMTVDDAQR